MSPDAAFAKHIITPLAPCNDNSVKDWGDNAAVTTGADFVFMST